MADIDLTQDTSELYLKVLQTTLFTVGLTKNDIRDGAYHFIIDYLYPYCMYRSGRVEGDALLELMKSTDAVHDMRLLPNQRRKLAELWQETPRERLDAFFLDWVEQLVAGNPPYSAMTGDEVYNAMVDWCTES